MNIVEKVLNVVPRGDLMEVSDWDGVSLLTLSSYGSAVLGHFLWLGGPKGFPWSFWEDK